jgi:predicted nucleotidyltransferase
MKAVGLITEYNPFHNGHAYHAQQARQVTNADVVVTVMSGNYVQRGEPAIFNKWRRTELALAGGVDLVYELPFVFAVQPAHIFAEGALTILHDLGVREIVFGAEHAELDFMALAKVAHKQLGDHADFKQDYRQTYATQFNDVLETIIGFRLENPNDLLGFAYANAAIALGWADEMVLTPIQRVKAGYHDASLPGGHIASATALRSASEDVSAYVSPQAADWLSEGPETYAWSDKWFDLLKYKVLTTPVAQLELIYQLNDGLAYRLKRLIETNPMVTWDDFQATFKSKRYTQARLQRTLLYTLLQITTEEMKQARPYLRLLGSNGKGRQYVKQQRESITLPTLNRVGKDDLTDLLQLDFRAGQLYQYCAQQTAYQSFSQDVRRQPIFYEETES